MSRTYAIKEICDLKLVNKETGEVLLKLDNQLKSPDLKTEAKQQLIPLEIQFNNEDIKFKIYVDVDTYIKMYEYGNK